MKLGISSSGVRNWIEVRIFSVLDIPESPLRTFALSEMAKVKEANEKKSESENNPLLDEEKSERINPFSE